MFRLIAIGCFNIPTPIKHADLKQNKMKTKLVWNSQAATINKCFKWVVTKKIQNKIIIGELKSINKDRCLFLIKGSILLKIKLNELNTTNLLDY